VRNFVLNILVNFIDFYFVLISGLDFILVLVSTTIQNVFVIFVIVFVVVD